MEGEGTVTEFGLSLPLSADIDKLVMMSRQAEYNGFDYVFMPDHVTSLDGKYPLNVWDVLSVLARETKRIKLGSLVANVYRQHPSTLKQHVDTLNRISKGRAFIGLGAGTRFDCEVLGIARKQPLKMVSDAISAVGDSPVVIGARGLGMKALASYTDGWVSRHALSPSEFEDEANDVADMVVNDEFLYIADVPVSFIDDEWVWKSLSYRYLLQTKYWNKVFTDEMRNGIEYDSQHVSKDRIRSFTAIGDMADVVWKLRDYVNAGANVLSIRLYGDSFDKMGEVIKLKI